MSDHADLPDGRDRFAHGPVRGAVRGLAAGAGVAAAARAGARVGHVHGHHHRARAAAVHDRRRLPAAALRLLPLGRRRRGTTRILDIHLTYYHIH